jgi:hypothetical protein
LVFVGDDAVAQRLASDEWFLPHGGRLPMPTDKVSTKKPPANRGLLVVGGYSLWK